MEQEDGRPEQQSGEFRIRFSLAGPKLPPVYDGDLKDGIYRWRVQQSLRPGLDPRAHSLHLEMDEIEIGAFEPDDVPGKQRYIRLGAKPGPWVFTIPLPKDEAREG